MNHPTIFKRTLLATALSATFAITGCGGGGGSSSPADSGSSFTGSVAGTAAKGLIQKGLVTAVELDSSGNTLRELGSATTDNEGKYSLDLDSQYGNGPIKVSVTATAESKMICDVHSSACTFGEPTDLPDDFVMDSILPKAEAEQSVSAPITPLTHMATSRAIERVKEGKAFDKDSVAEALSEVGQIVGVDILETIPVDITKADALNGADTNQKIYASFSAGIGKAALESGGDFSKGLRDLAESFKDGELTADDKITIREIVDAVRDEATEANLNDAVNDKITSIENRTGEDGSFNPEPLDDAASPDIVKGKQLLEDVRTWIGSFAAFESPMDGFAGDVELAGETFDSEAQALTELYAEFVDAVVDVVDAAETKVGTHSVAFQPSTTGEITEFNVVVSQTEADNALKLTVTETTINGISDQTTANLMITTNLPSDAANGNSFQLKTLDLVVSGGISNPDTAIELNSADLDYEAVDSVTVGGESDTKPVTESVSLAGQLTLSRTKANADGTSNQIQFVGKSTLVGVARPTAASDQEASDVALSSASLEGTITSVADSRSLSGKVSVTVDNAATFDTISFLNHDSELNIDHHALSDIHGIHTNPNNQAAQNGDGYYSLEFNIRENQTCYRAQSLTSDKNVPHCMQGDVLGISNQVLSDIQADNPSASELEHLSYFFNYGSERDGEQVIAEFIDTNYYASVRMPDFETAESFLKATVTVSTELNLPGLPNSQIVLNASRTGGNTGSASASIIQSGVERFNVGGTIAGDNAVGQLVFTNTDGAKMTLTPTPTSASGIISVNGTEVGEILERKEQVIINWKDGTFSTLN